MSNTVDVSIFKSKDFNRLNLGKNAILCQGTDRLGRPIIQVKYFDFLYACLSIFSKLDPTKLGFLDYFRAWFRYGEFNLSKVAETARKEIENQKKILTDLNVRRNIDLLNFKIKKYNSSHKTSQIQVIVLEIFSSQNNKTSKSLKTSNSIAKENFYYENEDQSIKFDEIQRVEVRKEVLPPYDAVKILQRSIRRAANAKKCTQKNHLPFNLLKKGVSLIDASKSNLESVGLHKAPNGGRSHVFFSQDVGLVIKSPLRRGVSDIEAEHERQIQKKRDARGICESNEYFHLIIPEASSYKEFLIETCLPISHMTTKEQVGLYVENQKAFTPAIKNLAEFLCKKASLSDLVQSKRNLWNCFTEVPQNYQIGRYDNIPLYIKDDKYLIGLVDLKDFSLRREKIDTDECYSVLQCLIGLFPYHFEEIMKIGLECAPDVRKYEEGLKNYRDAAITFSKVLYINHREFLKRHNIGLDKPFSLPTITPEKMENIKRDCLESIKNCDYYATGSCVKEFLEEVGERDEEFRNECFPNIVKIIFLSFEKAFKEQFNEDNSMMTMAQLLERRSLVGFSPEGFIGQDIIEELKKFKKSELLQNRRALVLDFINLISSAFAKNDLIAYFKRASSEGVFYFC